MSWVDLARAWHWSEDCPVFTIAVRDRDLPDPLIACGRWVSATVQLAGGGTRALNCDDDGAFLAFDPNSEGGRLYLVLPAAVRRVAATLWRPGARSTKLAALARSVGGSHVDGYPDVDVSPLGQIITIEYFAKKYGHGQGADDGATFFHDHQATFPWLAVSADGRLWYAGGEYDATDLRGIVG